MCMVGRTGDGAPLIASGGSSISTDDGEVEGWGRYPPPREEKVEGSGGGGGGAAADPDSDVIPRSGDMCLVSISGR